MILVIIGAVITLLLRVIQTLFTPMLLAFANSTTFGITQTICAFGLLASSILIGILPIKKGYAKILSILLFFAMLPLANDTLDYMIRSNIENHLQGRAWGFIGVISQFGYVVAYALSGFFAYGIGKIQGIGVGRGSGILIIISGVFLSVTAVILYQIKSVRRLEEDVNYEI